MDFLFGNFEIMMFMGFFIDLILDDILFVDIDMFMYDFDFCIFLLGIVLKMVFVFVDDFFKILVFYSS